jgi:hypothetical protein
MSCVWIGIADELRSTLGIKITKEKLYKKIKEKNTKTNNMLWNNEKLSETNLNENYQHIEALNGLTGGYLCSACDPLLLLIGQIYKISIQHQYCDTIIEYTNTTSNKKMVVFSNNHHFWSEKKSNKNYTKRHGRENKKMLIKS